MPSCKVSQPHLGTTDVWGWGLPCRVELSCHCRMFSSIPGLSPLDARSTHQVVTTKMVSRHCPMHTHGQNHPQLKPLFYNHNLRDFYLQHHHRKETQKSWSQQLGPLPCNLISFDSLGRTELGKSWQKQLPGPTRVAFG